MARYCHKLIATKKASEKMGSGKSRPSPKQKDAVAKVVISFNGQVAFPMLISKDSPNPTDKKTLINKDIPMVSLSLEKTMPLAVQAAFLRIRYNQGEFKSVMDEFPGNFNREDPERNPDESPNKTPDLR